MDGPPLKTLKELAGHLNRPAHRIIHLCEAGVVRPAVDAAGRGSARRFSRDDAFRLFLALELQEAGVQAPLIRPLMEALDRLLELPEVRKLRDLLGRHDLVGVVRHAGSPDAPVRAYLTSPDRVALVAPRLLVPSRPDVRVDLHLTDRHLPDQLCTPESCADPARAGRRPGEGPRDVAEAHALLLAELREDRGEPRFTERVRRAYCAYEALALRDLVGPLRAQALAAPDPLARGLGVEAADLLAQLHLLAPLLQERQARDAERLFRGIADARPDPQERRHGQLSARLARLLPALLALRRRASP